MDGLLEIQGRHSQQKTVVAVRPKRIQLMAHASLRKLRVAIYAYRAVTDQSTGITSSVYTRVPSSDFDGLWWASIGTVFGKETAPGQKPQAEDTSFWSFADEAPVEPMGIIAIGDMVRQVVSGQTEWQFSPRKMYRVQSVMARDYFRSAKQAYCTHVDDADVTFVTENNDVVI